MRSHRVADDAGPCCVVPNGSGGGAIRRCVLIAGAGLGSQADHMRLLAPVHGLTGTCRWTATGACRSAKCRLAPQQHCNSSAESWDDVDWSAGNLYGFTWRKRHRRWFLNALVPLRSDSTQSIGTMFTVAGICSSLPNPRQLLLSRHQGDFEANRDRMPYAVS